MRRLGPWLMIALGALLASFILGTFLSTLALEMGWYQ